MTNHSNANIRFFDVLEVLNQRKNMVSEEEISEITELAKKYPVIQKVIDQYSSYSKDGVKMIRASLNSELLKLNQDLSKPDTNYDFTLDRISEIAKTLKRLPKEVQAEEENKSNKEEKKESGKKKSVFDNEADKSR